MAGIALVALVIFGRSMAHYLDVTALAAALVMVGAGATVAFAAVFVSLRSVRRRRALTGGCVGCRFQCQHAMTDFALRQPGAGGPRRAGAAGPTRLWLISSVDRSAPTAEAPVMVPAARWPDHPLRADAPAQQKVRIPAGAR